MSLTLVCPPREADSVLARPELDKLNKQLSYSCAARAVIVYTRSSGDRVQMRSDVNNIALVPPTIRRKQSVKPKCRGGVNTHIV